jgi:hypothetical protein
MLLPASRRFSRLQRLCVHRLSRLQRELRLPRASAMAKEGRETPPPPWHTITKGSTKREPIKKAQERDKEAGCQFKNRNAF